MLIIFYNYLMQLVDIGAAVVVYTRFLTVVEIEIVTTCLIVVEANSKVLT